MNNLMFSFSKHKLPCLYYILLYNYSYVTIFYSFKFNYVRLNLYNDVFSQCLSVLIGPMSLIVMSFAPLISTHLYILVLLQNLLLEGTNKPWKCHKILLLTVKIQFIGSVYEVNPCQTQSHIWDRAHYLLWNRSLRINT